MAQLGSIDGPIHTGATLALFVKSLHAVRRFLCGTAVCVATQRYLRTRIFSSTSTALVVLSTRFQPWGSITIDSFHGPPVFFSRISKGTRDDVCSKVALVW